MVNNNKVEKFMQLNWTEEQVITDLNSLFSADNTLSSAQKNYSKYYGIDFENTLKIENNIDQITHEMGFFEVDEFTLCAHVYTHPHAKGTLLLLHGYYDHIGIYGSAIEFALKHQLNVFAYDLPGHGLSSGERASINDFQQYDRVFSKALELTQEKFKGLLHVMGQSTGCAIISNYLLTRKVMQQESPFQQVIFLAPLVRPHSWLKAIVAHSVLKYFVKSIKRTFGKNSKDDVFLNFLANKDPLQARKLSVAWVGALKKWVPMIESLDPVDIKLTIIQGTNDGTVDWEHNMEVLVNKYPQGKFHLIDDGCHQLVNEDKATKDQMYNILDKVFA
jgi:lysophospholipase